MPVGIRPLRVSRLTEVTSTMLRITLTGEALDAHTDQAGNVTPAFSSPGFDDDVRLLFPYPGDLTPVLPEIEHGRVTFAPGRRPIARAYTVRRFDPTTRELDIDIVLHGTGVASTWASTASVGDVMYVVGPGKTVDLPSGADNYLILGDDTAIPAVARLLEELPDRATGEVLLSVPGKEYRYELQAPAGVRVRWINADAVASPTRSPLLVALEATTLPRENLAVWVAGEQAEVREIRRFLVQTWELPRAAISFTGYWKRGQSGVPVPDASDAP
ncbi:Vibriobactin utilization protein ViuB [Leucobacter aridicollis]|uniref:siderophore-interacting protein n=1 Tax=Leucobacter aridicollis TaxID=283878 RepID=UPI002688BF4B